MSTTTVHTAAAAKAAFESQGIGGPHGIGGDGTTRLLPGIGKGRWRAERASVDARARREA